MKAPDPRYPSKDKPESSYFCALIILYEPPLNVPKPKEE